jgi:hypothetical protein
VLQQVTQAVLLLHCLLVAVLGVVPLLLVMQAALLPVLLVPVPQQQDWQRCQRAGQLAPVWQQQDWQRYQLLLAGPPPHQMHLLRMGWIHCQRARSCLLLVLPQDETRWLLAMRWQQRMALPQLVPAPAQLALVLALRKKGSKLGSSPRQKFMRTWCNGLVKLLYVVAWNNALFPIQLARQPIAEFAARYNLDLVARGKGELVGCLSGKRVEPACPFLRAHGDLNLNPTSLDWDTQPSWYR